MVLNLWSPDQQHQLHLGTCEKILTLGSHPVLSSQKLQELGLQSLLQQALQVILISVHILVSQAWRILKKSSYCHRNAYCNKIEKTSKYFFLFLISNFSCFCPLVAVRTGKGRGIYASCCDIWWLFFWWQLTITVLVSYTLESPQYSSSTKLTNRPKNKPGT